MRRGIWQVGSGPTSLESMRGDKDEDALSEDDDCLGSWLSQGCGWTGRFGAGWRRGLFALTAETEGAPNDARLVTTGFLRRPRNLTSKPENRPTPSQ